MAFEFDANSAKPVDAGGFDPSTATEVKPRGALAEIGTQLKAGVVADLPEMVGKAIQYGSNPGAGAYGVGKRIADAAKERGQAPELQPDPDSHNIVTNTLAAGARMLPQSVVPALAVGAGLATAPISGPAALAGSAILGSIPIAMSQGQETLDKAREAGIPDEVAIPAARKTALIEGAGETVGTYLGGKMLGVGGKAISTTVNRALGRAPGTAAGRVLEDATSRAVLKPWAKQVPETMIGEVGTEMGQNAGEAYIEQQAGIDKTTPGEAAIQAIQPTVGMTALLAPFGLVGHGINARVRAKRADTLASAEADPQQRIAIAAGIEKQLAAVDPQAAQNFAQHAARAVTNRQALAIDENLFAPPQQQGEPDLTTSAGAAPDAPAAPESVGPAAPDLSTSEGAGGPYFDPREHNAPGEIDAGELDFAGHPQPSTLTGNEPPNLMGNPLRRAGIGGPGYVTPKTSPSAKMGIDPAAGPLSAAAALAVDSGMSQAQEDSAAQTDGKVFKNRVQATNAQRQAGGGELVKVEDGWALKGAPQTDVKNAAKKPAAQAAAAPTQAPGAARTEAGDAAGAPQPGPAAAQAPAVATNQEPVRVPETPQAKPSRQEQQTQGAPAVPAPAADSVAAAVQPAGGGATVETGGQGGPEGALKPQGERDGQPAEAAAVQPAAAGPAEVVRPAEGAKRVRGGAAAGQPGTDRAEPVALRPDAQHVAGGAAGAEGSAAQARPLSLGITPNAAEPVTVKGGIVHIGKDAALDFDSGEPVKAPEGASDAQIKQALKDGGALSKRMKFFGGKAEEAQPANTPASSPEQPTSSKPEGAGAVGAEKAQKAPEPARSPEADHQAAKAAVAARREKDAAKAPPQEEAPKPAEAAQEQPKEGFDANGLLARGITSEQRAENFKRWSNDAPLVAEVRKKVAELTANWADAPPIHVVAQVSDLPGKNSRNTKGLYFKGEIWIVAERNRTLQEIGRTLAHEAIQHLGQRRRLGRDRWYIQMGAINDALEKNNIPLKRIQRDIRRLYVDDEGRFNLSPEIEADEIAARAIEASIDENGQLRVGFAYLKSVYAQVAEFLRSLGVYVHDALKWAGVEFSKEEAAKLKKRGMAIDLTMAELQGMMVLSLRNLEAGPRAEAAGQLVAAARQEGQQARGTTEDMASRKDVVGNDEGGRSADDDTDGAAIRSSRVRLVEEDYRLPNLANAIPKEYIPKEASQSTVKVYRAVPSDAKDATIRPGDWVSLNSKYAAIHGTGKTGSSKVISMEVPADHVAWAGTDMNEYFYVPREPNESPAPNSDGAQQARDDFNTEGLQARSAMAGQTNRTAQTAGPASMLTGQPLANTWQAPDASKLDNLIYSMQDKHVDTRRVVQAIRSAIGSIADRLDPYLQEELYHGRAAMATKEFLEKSLRPLLSEMQLRGVAVSDFEEYLHNRHAERRNVQVAKVNPKMPDGGSGIMTADARAYLAALPPAKRQAFEALARRVDAINRDTRALLVSSGLEKQSTIDAWNAAYGDEYVPLMREEMDNGTTGIGQGYSVRGGSSKRALGSNKPVADILANIALQREKAITRAEKRKVAEAVYAMAIKAPKSDFWFAVDPQLHQDPQQVLATAMQLISMGLDPQDAESIAREPTQRYVDPRTGTVTGRINPALRGADNVLAVRIDGEDKYVFFNARDPRAMRMVTALKNLDADQLGTVMGSVAKMTRYFAAINTQWNPVFGVTNITRDVQTALLNLNSTPLKNRKADVMKHILPALRGIYIDLRDHRAGKQPTSAYAAVFEEFQREGGATGYRDMYANAGERAEAIADELAKIKQGKALGLGRAVMGWLSDYNESMENAVRVSAYMVAKEQGLSNQQAASLAKNLTVNFNRKGQVALQAGALYAFFNASVQGSARIAQTLFEGGKLSATGQKIIAGGVLLGAMQALLLAAAGFDDDEPPDFVRERALVFPIGGDKYVSIPMPLGFHVIPNLGRIPAEWAMSGFKNTPKRIAQLVGMFADAFNPIGSAGLSLQTITPTIIDPLAALSENKDWTGKPIAKTDFNKLAPTAGHTRAKDTATPWARVISYAVNYATGGTDYKPGEVSPTPDQIDYLIGQAFGGIGREAGKLAQVASSSMSGEDLPLYKVPLIGRFVGTTQGQAAESARFYANLRELGGHKAELDGLRKDRKMVESAAYRRENPQAALVPMAERMHREVSKLHATKRALIERGVSPDQVKLLDARATFLMKTLNDRMRALEAQSA